MSEPDAKEVVPQVKVGSISMKTTHRVTKTTICEIPEVVRLCNSGS
jgi:hypothetical protein